MTIDTEEKIDFKLSDYTCGGAKATNTRGSITKPDFTMECCDCHEEFTIKSSYFEIDNEVCPKCGSGNLKELYVVFPKDGPGFQDNYNATNLTRCVTLDEEKKVCG